MLEKYFGTSWESLIPTLISYGVKLLVALLILFVGFRLAKFASNAIRKGFSLRHADANLVGFIATLVTTLIKVMAIISAITHLGIAMTSFAALLGAAALSIGMAFSGTLSNFAGGVIILFFKPFKSGDTIVSLGNEGVVQTVTIFNTILKTGDSKIIILPNGSVINNPLTNITSVGIRRAEWNIAFAYGDDIKVARKMIDEILKADERILKDKAIFVGLGELGDSNIIIKVRAWVNSGDHSSVLMDVNEKIYEKAAENGLHFPSPSMEVSLLNK